MKYNESLGKQLYLLINNKLNNINTNSNKEVSISLEYLLFPSFKILYIDR